MAQPNLGGARAHMSHSGMRHFGTLLPERDMSAAAPASALHSEDHEGWHRRWEEGRTAWHNSSVNPVLDVSGISTA